MFLFHSEQGISEYILATNSWESIYNFENFFWRSGVDIGRDTYATERRSCSFGSLIFHPGKRAAVPIPSLCDSLFRKNTYANNSGSAISTRPPLDRFTGDIFRFWATLDDENTPYFPTSFRMSPRFAVVKKEPRRNLPSSFYKMLNIGR